MKNTNIIIYLVLRISSNILAPVFFVCIQFTVCAQNLQRYNSFGYSVNDGLLQSNIIDMNFDKNNFCWLSFANGIQKFDGKNFVAIPLQPGLPDDKWANIFRCRNGELLFSHSRGISKYIIESNRFIELYSYSVPLVKPASFIGEDENLVYLYTATGNKILELNHDKVSSLTETAINFVADANDVEFHSNIIEHKVALRINTTVFLWDLRNRKTIYQSEPIPEIFTYFLQLNNEHEFLFYTNSKELYVYDFLTRKASITQLKLKNTALVFRSVFYQWDNKHLFTAFNDLFEFDPQSYAVKSALVNFQNKPIANNAAITKIREDNYGNLYLITVNDGFRKIIKNSYTVKYYGTDQKQDNYTISIIADKANNRILAGTYGNGLLVFDTLQHLVKHIKYLPGETIGFSASAMLKTNKGDYLLFIWSEETAWLLSKDLSKLSPIKIPRSSTIEKAGVGYFASILFQNETKAIVRSERRFHIVNFANVSITEHAYGSNSSMSGIMSNGQIITHVNDELIFFDTTNFKEIKRIVFKNTAAVRCFAKGNSNDIYIGCNNGLFKIDDSGKILMHLDKKNGLPDDCIYSMVVDDKGFLWCSSNKGIFRINKDNRILQLKKEQGLQENEFNTNIATKTADGEIFFGGVNGISSFYPTTISDFEDKLNLVFTKIKINNEERFNDSAAWNISMIDLPYNENTLSFDFIAMANNNPDQYIYQYKMDAIDAGWIQNNDLQTVRYFLPPGKYTFKIYASRFFDKDAKPMKEIHINIHPPVWKTWWFRILVTTLLISILGYSINQYSHRKYRRQLAALEAEHNLRLERERISRDLHDSIGAYANAVLYNTQLLETEKETKLRDELMKDLKFASKDIITSLRETIWALKKDNYTAEDCLLRIRNFVQPLSRYYQQIKFEIEGHVPPGKHLHYTKALNLVRIVQESVTNAIKHTDAKNISVSSNVKGGNWELAVTDDGNGFDQEKIQQDSRGNGLDNMKQRAADAGFDLTIRSSMETGTSIVISI